MIAKIFKCTGKEINYILKKRNAIFAKTFGFLWIPQYKNNTYNQRSIQIPVKISKSSVVRNSIKRAIFEFLQEYTTFEFWKIRYKTFIICNKQSLENLQKVLATADKKSIKKQLLELFMSDFQFFMKKAWNPSNIISKKG